MEGQLDHKIFVSPSLFRFARFGRVTTLSIPSRQTDAFEEHGIIVVKSPVMQL